MITLLVLCNGKLWIVATEEQSFGSINGIYVFAMGAIGSWYYECSLYQDRTPHRIQETAVNASGLGVCELSLAHMSSMILTIKHIKLNTAMTYFVLNTQVQNVPSLFCRPTRFSTYLPIEPLVQTQKKSYDL